MFGGGRIRSSSDSPLEGAGFEPSVPLEVLTVAIVPCRLRGPFHASLPKTKFAADSAVEGTGFEPSVPRGKGPTLRVSVLFRSDFSVGGEPTRGDIEKLVVSRGTVGSNP